MTIEAADAGCVGHGEIGAGGCNSAPARNNDGFAVAAAISVHRSPAPPMVVTIDGPAGTGKSTAARRLAEVLGFHFLDTGAMYRVIALLCVEQRFSPEDDAVTGEVARRAQIEFDAGRTLVDGRDVSSEIRSIDVTQAASIVARNPSVRAAMVEQQRQFAEGRRIVTEGRDQGTIVFPKAECKFYLTADPVERARRRFEELKAQGKEILLEDLLQQQQVRDERDETRNVAPLRAAEDAIIIDTTRLTLEQVLDKLQALVQERAPR
jgi:cytidylate kinase